jgi:hypothetical protein
MLDVDCVNRVGEKVTTDGTGVTVGIEVGAEKLQRKPADLQTVRVPALL